MTQPEKACVIVDDEIEIHLTDVQLEYMNERKRLGRRSCDPNVTIMGSDEFGMWPEQVDECSEFDNGTNSATTELTPPTDADSTGSSETRSVDNNHDDEFKPLVRDQPSKDETVHQRSEACEQVSDDTNHFVELATEGSPGDKRFLSVPDQPEDFQQERDRSDFLSDTPHRRIPHSDKACDNHINDENAPPKPDPAYAGRSSKLIPETKNSFDEGVESTPDVDYLSSKMSRAVLSAQRKQLFHKSFQGCNYLDVGKLRSPNTKQVQSVLKTYISTVSPGKQQHGKTPAPSTPLKASRKVVFEGCSHRPNRSRIEHRSRGRSQTPAGKQLPGKKNLHKEAKRQHLESERLNRRGYLHRRIR
ncbi:hypothetical protein BIW11_13484 [Tropilaelaps mercedesae]|uniref:Uncharacterized protein n=1 Tax=Tropilaelaps mercedesae TaxID=418985 RepID=A0A1V9X288_9ACAR|nr:hypothetical protein BIW11_13484 [Tropilaelaps mercedesae]